MSTPWRFHARQHRHQRHFDFLEDVAQAGFGVELRSQMLVQAQGDVGVLGGVTARAVDGDGAERYLLRALAGDVFVADGLVAEILQRQRVHVVARRGAV